MVPNGWFTLWLLQQRTPRHDPENGKGPSILEFIIVLFIVGILIRVIVGLF